MVWDDDCIYECFLTRPTLVPHSGPGVSSGCTASIRFSLNLQTDGPEVTVYLVLYVYTDGFVNKRNTVSHKHTGASPVSS